MPQFSRRQLCSYAALLGAGLWSDVRLGSVLAAAPPTGLNYNERPEIIAFLKEVSREKGIPMEWLETEIALARYSPLAERYMTPKPKQGPATTPDRNFRLYHRNMVNFERVNKGVDFLNRHASLFAQLEEDTGVSRYAITAIIGIETIYGKNMGNFRVLDVLTTLAFDYTRREKFYRKELAEFFDFCWRDKLPTVSVTGSYAGAIGLGQFMPSSLNRFGTDGDDDGFIDIVNNEADGIASVAAYLKEHGWKAGLKPLYAVKQKIRDTSAEPSTGIRPDKTVSELFEHGIEPVGFMNLSLDHPVLLVELLWQEAGGAMEKRLYIGTQNFSAFLYYNRSYFYAAAVSMLAAALESAVTNHADTPAS